MLDDRQLITVTDLKQYAYCPRVIYYERCMPHIRPRTYMMDAGKDAHEEEQRRAARRLITPYDVLEGERRFNLRLMSETLGLWGMLDEVVFAPGSQAVPVDYKLATSVGNNHRVQLTAYALLLEADGQHQVPWGFVYLIPKRKLVKVVITPQLRESTHALIRQVQEMIRLEHMPAPIDRIGQCAACEFRRFCNDV